ncbi:MAG: sigma factor, partial [Rhodospirillales bacterium]
MTADPASTDVKVLIIDIIPNLRAFARTLVNDRDRADDLVQETVLKALSNLD